MEFAKNKTCRYCGCESIVSEDTTVSGKTLSNKYMCNKCLHMWEVKVTTEHEVTTLKPGRLPGSFPVVTGRILSLYKIAEILDKPVFAFHFDASVLNARQVQEANKYIQMKDVARPSISLKDGYIEKIVLPYNRPGLYDHGWYVLDRSFQEIRFLGAEEIGYIKGDGPLLSFIEALQRLNDKIEQAAGEIQKADVNLYSVHLERPFVTSGSVIQYLVYSCGLKLREDSCGKLDSYIWETASLREQRTILATLTGLQSIDEIRGLYKLPDNCPAFVQGKVAITSNPFRS